MKHAQGNAIAHYGRRVIRVRAAITFEVCDVKYPILSVGKLIRKGARLTLDMGKCELEYSGRRIEVHEQEGVFKVTLRVGDVGQLAVSIPNSSEISASESR